MKRTNRRGLAALALLFIGAMVYADAKVTITAPTIIFHTGTTLDTELNNLFSETTGTVFKQKIADLEAATTAQIAPYTNQEKLPRGFADANVASAQSATMQGYQGYKIFAITSGVMIGGQLPTLDTSKITGLLEEMQKDPDLYVGVEPSIAFINVGVNAGKLVGIFNPDFGGKLKDLYFNAKFGVMNYTYAMNDTSLAMNTMNFGFGVNYQLLAHSPSLLGGFFMWRGINLATGINYQYNDITYGMTFAKQTQTITTDVASGTPYATTATAVLSLIPKATIGLNAETFSVPLEATTSVQLLWLANVNLGIGADLAFGSATLTAKGTSTIKVDSVTVGGSAASTTSTDGSAVIDASTKAISPTLVRPRISGGLGLNLGPVKVDVPVYYYFDYGFAAGLSVGLIW